LAGNRENGPFPAICANLAIQAEQEIRGKEKLTNLETMKKRLQKGESLGVLRKSARGKWTLIHAGKSGKEREK
jgi:ABC-type protease/lipase transport system fused ATPase/permease subunit